MPPSLNADLTPEQGLTFLWPSSERWYKSRLLRFLLISILGHVLAFLLFQIVTQEKVTAPNREQELQLLSADLPEHQALLEAVEAEVPLAALSHRLLPSEELLHRPYRSAFADTHPSLKETPRWKAPVKTLLPSFSPRSTPPAPASSEPTPFPGQLLLDSDLQSRLATIGPLPAAPAGKLLESPVFLLGIAPAGEVEFVFLEKSSGDAEADSAAQLFLQGTPFRGGANGIMWGQARLVWRSAP
jgi:hypothetical protein